MNFPIQIYDNMTCIHIYFGHIANYELICQLQLSLFSISFNHDTTKKRETKQIKSLN